MEQIFTSCFEFKKGNIFLIGSIRTIKNIHNHYLTQKELGNGITLDTWYQRIIPNRIYGHFEAKNLHGLTILIPFYLKMKKAGLWVNGAKCSEAMYLANQKSAGELLKITEDEAKMIKESSFWKDKFLY